MLKKIIIFKTGKQDLTVHHTEIKMSCCNVNSIVCSVRKNTNNVVKIQFCSSFFCTIACRLLFAVNSHKQGWTCLCLLRICQHLPAKIYILVHLRTEVRPNWANSAEQWPTFARVQWTFSRNIFWCTVSKCREFTANTGKSQSYFLFWSQMR